MTLIHFFKTQSQIWWRSMTISAQKTQQLMRKAEKQWVGLQQLLVCNLPVRKQHILFWLAPASFAAGHSLPWPLRGPFLVFWLLWLCPPLPHNSLANCLLFKAPSFPPSYSFCPLFQTHRGNLSTSTSSNHAAGASHSFPLCLPYLLGQ